jgi:hypothetical protein
MITGMYNKLSKTVDTLTPILFVYIKKIVAEPLELIRLKCTNHHHRGNSG